MKAWRFQSVRYAGRGLTLVGTGLLIAGALIGWLMPHLAEAQGSSNALGLVAHIPRLGIDVSGFLAADLTALAVLISVLLGFNVAALQLAGDRVSPALVRSILLSIGPFLACWSLSTGTVLIYFLWPPVFVAQLWQVLLWFGAVVALMVGYLWSLPWRLSGEYAAYWSTGDMASTPIQSWEELDGYAILYSGLPAIAMRGDLLALRAMARILGSFLVAGRVAGAARSAGSVDVAYRVLKNLLSGCAQQIDAGPHAVAYELGFVTVGTLLRVVSLGHPVERADSDLFSGLVRALRRAPDRIDPLWTGVRHALCRRDAHGEPYLVRYWTKHSAWAPDDPRSVTLLAAGLARLYADLTNELQRAQQTAGAEADAATMLVDLYRYIAQYLVPEAGRRRRKTEREALIARCLLLLDTIHQQALQILPASMSSADREAITRAYEQRHQQIEAAS